MGMIWAPFVIETGRVRARPVGRSPQLGPGVSRRGGAPLNRALHSRLERCATVHRRRGKLTRTHRRHCRRQRTEINHRPCSKGKQLPREKCCNHPQLDLRHFRPAWPTRHTATLPSKREIRRCRLPRPTHSPCRVCLVACLPDRLARSAAANK
jgi:hypothetical protein